MLELDFEPLQSGDRFYTSESDVCRRQILTYKDDPRTERIKIFIMAVDTWPYTGIQMNRKEVTKKFMMLSNCLHGLTL